MGVVVASLAALLLSFLQPDQAPPVQLELQVLRTQTETRVLDKGSIYQGETLWLVLQIDLEQQFLEQQLLPQWRFPLDFQAELKTPWLEASPSFRILETRDAGLLETADTASTSMVIDREKGSIQRLETTADGLVRFQLKRKILVLGGSFELAPAHLKLVWATEFEDDMIRGLIPTNQQSTTLTTPTFHCEVLPIPITDRPSSFSGAVGDYTMQLSEVAGGSPRKLQIGFRGFGHLDSAHLPSLAQLADFPLSGNRLEVVDGGILLHLETRSEAALPELHWSFFNPVTASFVSRSVGAPVLESDETNPSQIPWMWLGGATLLFVAIFFLPKRSPAAEVIVTHLKEPKDLLDDLALFLSCSRDSIYADGLRQKLVAKNLDAQLASDLAVAIHAIHQARYAGQGCIPSEESLIALRERFQASR